MKVKNGGRSITLNSTKINVLSGYSPEWTKEYGESMTTWDGRNIRRLKGVRFSLEFSTYGMNPDEIKKLSEIFTSENISLDCAEFKGPVYCDNLSANLKNANFYGVFFNTTIKLTASELTAVPEVGCL